MRIALAQINPAVGDIDGNAKLIVSYIERAREAGADLVVFPELALCGYPPKDLLLQEHFVEVCAMAAKQIGERHTGGITAVIGCPLAADEDKTTGRIANSALVYRDGDLVAYYDKRLLPTYDVFDEDRYFTPGREACVFGCAGKKIGIAICEDLWKGFDAGFASHYSEDEDPVAALIDAEADVIISPSASPFVLGKGLRHRALLSEHAKRHNVWVAAVNQVGGNDELIFDGHAALIAPSGELVAAGAGFEEHLLVADLDEHTPPVPDPRVEASAEEHTFRALVLGTRDYAHKTGFKRVLIGLSGGIDSAATAAIAAAALGPGNVLGVSMPGKYSSEHSKSDAQDLADRLRMRMITIPIASPFDGFREALDPAYLELDERTLGESLPDIAEENLQSRVRGTTLMAISNRTGALLLTTGNKSEIAVGYSTLYGDMNGGLAVLSDVPKTSVYTLCRWMNDNARACGFEEPPIPQGTIDKPPSAELAPDQKDQDSLPPYDVLDEIIERYVERRQAPSRIIEETGFDRDVVRRIVRLIHLNEYKRKQLAIGLKITHVAFGTGRRVPIAQQWDRH